MVVKSGIEREYKKECQKFFRIWRAGNQWWLLAAQRRTALLPATTARQGEPPT